MNSWKILSCNVNGLGTSSKRRKLFEYVIKKADIILIQESHSTSDTVNIWRQEWKECGGGDNIFFSHGTSKSKGVVILVNSSLDFIREKVISDDQGRILIVKGCIQGKHYLI